jgi:hypothetical protein
VSAGPCGSVTPAPSKLLSQLSARLLELFFSFLRFVLVLCVLYAAIVLLLGAKLRFLHRIDDLLASLITWAYAFLTVFPVFLWSCQQKGLPLQVVSLYTLI